MTLIETSALLSSLSAASLLPSPLIPSTFNPTVQLSVSFNNVPVEAGNLFRASACRNAPAVSFTPEDDIPANTRYTLMLVDPDAPTPGDPKFAYWRHWVISFIPRPESVGAVKDVVTTGKTLTEYLGPGPKDDSEPHRYLFLLFREPGGLRELGKEDVGGEEFVQRRTFGVKEWTEGLGMRLVAVNWMLGAGNGWKANDGKDEL